MPICTGSSSARPAEFLPTRSPRSTGPMRGAPLFRYWKAEGFEGGCLTPMIVQWPKGLKSLARSITGQMGHVIDLIPTFLELAGVAYAEKYAVHDLKPLLTEGKSLGRSTRVGRVPVIPLCSSSTRGACGRYRRLETGSPGRRCLGTGPRCRGRHRDMHLADRHPQRVAEPGQCARLGRAGWVGNPFGVG